MHRLEIALLLVPVLYGAEPIRINEKQVDVLRKDAEFLFNHGRTTSTLLDKLEQKAGFGELKLALIKGVNDASASVERTQNEFTRAADTDLQRQGARVFFGDIAVHYDSLQKGLSALEPAGYKTARARALGRLSDHYTAYKFVAENKSLTFDLSVESRPEDGAVSYKRTGDSYQAHDKPTDTVLSNLVYAIWIVRVQKPGYKDQEKTHDPFKEKNHVLHFDLMQ